MNADELEREIRATLHENVHDISAASLVPPDLLAVEARRRAAGRGWWAPVLAAAAVLVIAGIVGGFLATSGKGHGGKSTMSSGGGPLTGTWQLVSASIAGRPVELSSTWVVRLSFGGNDTILVDDGVNTTTLTGQGENGSLRARFRSTTYVLDPRGSEPAGQELLHLLDSLAPSSTPDTLIRSSYEEADDQLSIRAPAGQLVLRQVTSNPAGREDGPGAVSTTPSPARSA